MFGSPETTTGGNALKFYSSMRLDIRRIGAIRDKEEIVGNQTRVKVAKNKVAPPFKVVEFDIMYAPSGRALLGIVYGRLFSRPAVYGGGISKTGEIVDLGVKAGLVDKSGTWFSYDEPRCGAAWIVDLQGMDFMRI